MDANKSEYDDFMQIRGIGKAGQRLLHDELHIHTFEALSALSVDELDARSKAAGFSFARNMLEQWIAQARDLAAARAAAKLPTGEATPATVVPPATTAASREAPAPSHPAAEPAALDVNAEPAPAGAAEEWKPFASFVIEFQTRKLADQPEEQRTKVHYVEADKEQIWPGLNGEAPCLWMRDQVLGSREQVVEAPVPLPAGMGPVVEIVEINAFQPPELETPIGSGRAGQVFTGLLTAEEPFALEVLFHLTRTIDSGSAQPSLGYRSQFYTRSIITGEKVHLGDTTLTPLVAGQSVYTSRLPAATLPPGNYRLQALVTFPGLATVPGFCEIPLLQVIAS